MTNTPYKDLSRSIHGRVAIITGAASGMGRATAHLFARQGAAVALADLDIEKLKTVQAEIEAANTPGKVSIFALDVSDADAIRDFTDQVIATYGQIDIIINNAGFSLPTAVDADGYDDVWARAVAVMMSSHQVMIRACLPHLRKSDCARVVNIASTEGLGATPTNSAYSAAKHGVIGITRSFAVELGREGITVNCICPGPIHTGITADIQDEHKTIYAKRRVPLRRYGHPEEVANITLSCVLPAASYLNGVVIPVDGGMIIKNA